LRRNPVKRQGSPDREKARPAPHNSMRASSRGTRDDDAISGRGSPAPPLFVETNRGRFSGAATATQSRSNPVSGRCLPKTGIFQISAGDYRRFRSRSGQFGSTETDSQFAKARHWRAFLRLQRVKSPGAGLPGWGGRILTPKPKAQK
jgi:hypothetical protein